MIDRKNNNCHLGLCTNCGTQFLVLEKPVYELFETVKNNGGEYRLTTHADIKVGLELTMGETQLNKEKAKAKEFAIMQLKKFKPGDSVYKIQDLRYSNYCLFSYSNSKIHGSYFYSQFPHRLFDREFTKKEPKFLGFQEVEYEHDKYRDCAVATIEIDETITLNKYFDEYMFVLENMREPLICPCCKEDAYYFRYDFNKFCAFDLNYQKFIKAKDDDLRNSFIKESRQETKDEYDNFILKCKNVAIDSITGVTDLNIKDYLYNLIELKKNIRFLSNRLNKLYADRNLEKRYDKVRKNKERFKYLLEIEQIQNNINELSCNLTKEDVIGYYNLLKPEKPKDFNLEIPSEPQYSTPNIFNKKRILSENEFKKKKYEEKLKEYEIAQEIHKQEINSYNILLEEFDNLVKKKTNELQEQRKEKVSCLEEKLYYLQNINSADLNDSLSLQFYKEEIDECEALLLKLYKAKREFESLNIVFPKYLDILALSTIYEYILVGRCTGLTGPNGAYNLYESELRQNIIISKLDVVIEKLEDIKQNQYMAYQMLSDINSNLDNIGSKMDTAIDSLNRIDNTANKIYQTTEDIKEISEVTAYNTAKTAYYSKVNAELTNALGFMVALK